MTNFKKLTLALSVATIAIGGIAVAQAGSGMRAMDPDGDGVVTRAEAQQAAAEMFTRLDADKDGKLAPADRAARHAEMRGKMFAKLDANGDGAISRDEFMADRGPGMGGLGMGGPEMGGPGMGHGRGHEGGHGGGHGMRGHHGGMMMARMADADKDGAISKAEFTSAAMKHFDTADANHDGKITAEERKAAHQAMKGRWKDRAPAPPAGQ